MEYLIHSSKGSSWKNHKYISKYYKNGKPVYVYYSKTESSGNGSDKTDFTEEIGKGISNTFKKYINSGKRFIQKISSRLIVAKYKWKNFNTPTTEYTKPYVDKFISKFLKRKAP